MPYPINTISSQALQFLFSRKFKIHIEDIIDELWVRSSKVIEIVHLYLRAKKPVIIINAEKITSSELALINDLALITGNVGIGTAGIIVLRSAGTFTNCERRIHRAIPSPSGKDNWQIISAMAAALGYPMNYASASNIYAGPYLCNHVWQTMALFGQRQI